MTPDQLLVRTLGLHCHNNVAVELVYRSHRKRVAPTDDNEDGNFCAIRSKGNW